MMLAAVLLSIGAMAQSENNYAFGLEGDMASCEQQLVKLFESLGVPMYFEGEASQASIADIDFSTSLSIDEVKQIINKCQNHTSK